MAPQNDTNLTEWLKIGTFRTILGRKVFIIDSNSAKEPLLILHGFPTSSFDFYKVLPLLEPHFRVIIHDHLGFGYSEKPTEYSYSFIEQTDMACAVWEHLGISEGHVLAHDYGTSIATELVARGQMGQLKLEIKSLTICNGSIHIELSKLRLIQKLLRNKRIGDWVAKLATQRTFNRNMSKIWYDPSMIEQADLDQMWALLEWNNGRKVLPKISRYTIERYTFWHRWIDALQRTDIPVNILWAENDPIAVLEIAHTLHKEIKDARLKLLPNLGHYPMLEAPQIWSDAVVNLLTKSEK